MFLVSKIANCVGFHASTQPTKNLAHHQFFIIPQQLRNKPANRIFTVPLAFYSFGGLKSSSFGDHNQYGMEGLRFYTKAECRVLIACIEVD